MTTLQTALTVATAATASGTLAAGKHTPADATSGALTMTLPTPATVGARLRVEKTDATANVVSVSGTIRGAASTINLAWQYESVELFAESLTSWRVAAGHKTKASMDAAYVPKWAPNTAYAQNAVVSNGGQLYAANSAFTSGATFSGANWTQITGNLPAYSTRQTDVLRGDGSWDMPNGPASLAYADDFLQGTGTTSYWPWSLTNFASGSFGSAVSAVDANHPGVVKLTSSTTASSGGFIGTQSGMFILGGNEDTTAIFQLPTVTGALAYFGFFLGNTAAAPTRGVWLNIAGATVTGMAADSAGTATTGTSTTITASHWYRARVVAVSATQAAFYLYDCATGALVWSDVVASNAQTTSGLYHSFLAANTGTTAQDILYLDYMSVRVNRALVR